MASGPRKPLPRAIAKRILVLPPHVRALRENLERISLDEYKLGLASRTTNELNVYVYPIERPFEIVDNILLELAEEALAAAGKATGPRRADDLQRLRDNKVIGERRRRRLAEIHRVRNDAQHAYVDVDPKVLYEAGARLADDAIGFLQDLVDWLRDLGFELPERRR